MLNNSCASNFIIIPILPLFSISPHIFHIKSMESSTSCWIKKSAFLQKGYVRIKLKNTLFTILHLRNKINIRGESKQEILWSVSWSMQLRMMANICLINGSHYGDKGKLDERTRKYCEEQYDPINEPQPFIRKSEITPDLQLFLTSIWRIFVGLTRSASDADTRRSKHVNSSYEICIRDCGRKIGRYMTAFCSAPFRHRFISIYHYEIKKIYTVVIQENFIRLQSFLMSLLRIKKFSNHVRLKFANNVRNYAHICIHVHIIFFWILVIYLIIECYSNFPRL